MARLTSTFRGYSSVGTSFLSPVRYDLDLARQDLLNHFNTRKGERIMLPEFGSIVWDMLFEPLDETTRQIIGQDITKIASYDPRLRVGQVAITQQDTGLQIQLTLSYVPTNQADTILLNFNRNSETLTVN